MVKMERSAFLGIVTPFASNESVIYKKVYGKWYMPIGVVFG